MNVRAALHDPRALGGLVVALAALAAHATVLSGGFIWLDHAHIVDGAALAPPSRWLELFTQGFAGTGFYRPLMALKDGTWPTRDAVVLGVLAAGLWAGAGVVSARRDLSTT